ncbi:MAG TPA: MFS transporter, partial [Chloroflexota bacterium]|nr:MFS transporter [Chloroflexota bacterium]
TGVVYPSWGETFANTNLWLLGLAHVLTYGVYVALTTWSTTFLWQRHGVGLEWAGPLAALMAVSAVLGRILGGTLSVGRERTVMLVSCAGAALFTVLFPLMPDLASSLVALLGLGWFASMPFGAVFSYIGKVSSSRVAGRGLAVINFVGNIGAFAFPPLVGYALDLSGSFILGFGVVALVGLVGTLVLMVSLPRPEAKP